MEAPSNIRFKDYYKILGVDRNCPDAEIKKAFRALALKYHPDVTRNNKILETKFKDICEAYEVLSDPERRRMYDQLDLHAWNNKGITAKLDEQDLKKKEGGTFSDFFYSIFGSVKDNTLKNIKKINNVEKEISITLEEALNGTKKDISIPTEETCQNCAGEGNVKGVPCLKCKGKGIIIKSNIVTAKIPPNVSHLSRLIIKGEGFGSGVLKGDLLLNVKLQEHDFFDLDENGADITCTIPLTVTEAVLGTDIEVPTLKGSVKMKIPPGTQADQLFRLKGRGMFNKKNNVFGEQYVKISIVVPKELSSREMELYQQLALLERLSPRDEIYKMFYNIN